MPLAPGAALSHYRLVEPIGEADGVRFLAMELVEGEDLAQRLERGPIPVPEAFEVTGDGRRFLVVRAAGEQGPVPGIAVVQNWTAEFRN